MKYNSGEFILAATDLSNYLNCEHLSYLERLVALGEVKRPYWEDPALDVLIKRGDEHEKAYVLSLQTGGLNVVNLRGQSLLATLAAMREGVDVIVQAQLSESGWMGYSDVLMKVDRKSVLGNWAYEVQDTKLAQQTKAATILQLCLYSDMLATLQGVDPEKMSVVKPGNPFQIEHYHFAAFKAYYRTVKASLRDFVLREDTATYPIPVEHCSICRWWNDCDKKRRADDHLALVAGITSLHIEELNKQHIHTLEEFALAKKLQKPDRGNLAAFERRQAQAKIQLSGRLAGKLLYATRATEPERGLSRLPAPDPGDVYFDIEGDAFFDRGGLEYLLGYAVAEKEGQWTYKGLWSIDRLEEKHAFVAFMQFITERWKRFPNFYIYHFAPYEPSAVKRLARVHAVFEMEVDDLLRAERFIDLHAVFKEALLASVERYSLKELEKFTDYKRQIELRDASMGRKTVEVALELSAFKDLSQETVNTVERYNEDDCLATAALHQWLEQKRSEYASLGQHYQRPAVKFGEATESVQNQDSRAQKLFRELTGKLPDTKEQWTGADHAKWLLAHQIEYFRREDKSAWWEYFRVHELEDDELLEERSAITGLKFMIELPKSPGERNPTHRYSFPPQEISVDEGDKLMEVKGATIGSVKAISQELYTIDIKKAKAAVDVHPHAIHVQDVIGVEPLPTALMDLASAIDDEGLEHAFPYAATKDLLMRRKPQLLNSGEGAFVLPGESSVEAAIRIALSLDKSVLAVQGPPGSGKTFTGAHIILALLKAGKRVGITATSHKVIRNLEEEVIRLSQDKTKVQVVHKISNGSDQPHDGIEEVDKSDQARKALDAGKLVGGTAWLWAEKNSDKVLDYLVVDEAGQMSLSHVIAASQAAKNIILLGDPQQLEQPQRGAHPEGSDVAALAYLMDGELTIPEGKGLFLALTRRLHPRICQFTSEMFYEGRLDSFSGLERQHLGGGTVFDGAGLFYVPVHHSGNQNKSSEEINAIVLIVNQLLTQGTYTDAEGILSSISLNDIVIVAPYNAQVSALIERFPGMRIGTVDKFQGQQAPVVIYSMTSSSTQDAPRGMNFLFNPNRFNVATSRAKCTCILVASSKLFEAECHTIDQMRWANTLCRYVELAKTVEIAVP